MNAQEEFEQWQQKQLDWAERYSDELISTANEVIDYSIAKLYTRLRYMANAIGRFNYVPYNGTITCDGENIYYDPEWIISRCEATKGHSLPAHDILHQILHCIYRHQFVSPTINRRLWNLATDIAVTSVIADMDRENPISIKKRKKLDELKSEIGEISAERMMQYFDDLSADEKEKVIESLEEDFGQDDDHESWYNMRFKQDKTGKAALTMKLKKGGKQSSCGGSNNDENNSNNNDEDNNGSSSRKSLEEKWREISEHVQKDIEEFNKDKGDGSGNLAQSIRRCNREKYDYTEFLKKFTTIHEVMKINLDEFDYNIYSYGLQTYGNIALVEPLEYKDDRKLHDFVIAIDTSGSVYGDLVQAFLNKTYNIIMNNCTDNNLNIWIVQCDAKVQEAKQITSKEDFERYITNMELHGFGGTDFRPVFEFVDKKINDGTLKNMKGMIYFTDGYGTFPKRMPNYDAAFVFVNERNNPDFEPPEVPSWAIKLVLDGREVMK